MMRVAFDVKGTLVGLEQKKVRMLQVMLRDAGHDITVWSNSIGYAKDFVEDHGLTCDFMLKRMKSDVEEEDMFDVAIEDDRMQTWLAAKRIIFVDEIPETFEEIKDKFGDLL